MQGRRETRLGQAGIPATYLRKMPGFSLLPFVIHFRFSLSPSVYFSSLSAPLPDRIDSEKCRRCWLLSLLLFWPVARTVPRQAAAACDRANTRSKNMEVFLVKTSGFLCILDISESRSINQQPFDT